MNKVELVERVIEETEEYEDCLITRVITEVYQKNPQWVKLQEVFQEDNESLDESVGDSVEGHMCRVNCPKKSCRSV
tara:strand:+ start:6404 stop:6631 length:228 start_codon:yes stop_codon:yes gene_type:complete